MGIYPDDRDSLIKARELETVDEFDRHDIDAEELRELPDKKLVELFSSTRTKACVCEECGETTLLVATAGHNCRSECHNCGEEYYIVG